MVTVVEYTPEWPVRFETLRSTYADALTSTGARYRSIEHIGSTSVPGLPAKPVIDVDIVVDAPDVEGASRALETIGFDPRGDLGVEGRFAFETPDRFAPTNTYVVVVGSLALRNHLAVRDVLRMDAQLRNEYASVKVRAASLASGIDEYLLLKGEVLGRILERAGLSLEDRESIAQTNRRIATRGARG